MEIPQTQDKPLGAEQIAQINNLDTARMALRWALERLTLLEGKGAELEASLVEADKKLREAEARAEAAREALSERDGCMKVAEEIGLLKPDVKEPLEALAKREAALQRLHEGIVAGLKRRLAVAEEASRRSQAVTEGREALLTEREKVWLKEKEEAVGRREAASRGEKLSWERQKAQLLEELALAREGVTGQADAVLELERRAVEAQREAAQAADLAEHRKLLLEEQARRLDRERAELEARIRSLEAEGRGKTDEAVRRSREAQAQELSRLREEADLWRRRYQETLGGSLELEKRSVEAEERALRAEERVKGLLSQVAYLEERITMLEASARLGGTSEADLRERELRLDERARELATLTQTLEARLGPRT